jgi:hypothetical protein
MFDRNAKVKELIEMQKKFIAYEQKNGLDPKDYYMPDEGHELNGYKEKFNDLAMDLVEKAHADKGSKQ